MTKSKTKIMSLIFAFLLCFGTLFANLANRTLTASAEAKTVTQVNGNVYKDAEGKKYFKQTVFPGPVLSMDESGEFAGMYREYTFSNGDNMLQIAQSENKERFFAYEPIVWRVLNVYENGIALLVSNKVLANMSFQPTYNIDSNTGKYYTTANGGDGTSTLPNDYTYSNIRYWLNSVEQTGQTSENADDVDYSIWFNLPVDMGYPTFLQHAFSESEKVKIKATSGIGASDATTYNADGAEDKIFLLSQADVKNTAFFANDDARKIFCTDLAKATYIIDGEFIPDDMSSADRNNGGVYYLRSPDTSASTFIYCVNTVGYCMEEFIHSYGYGIAPAMYLDTTDIQAYSDSSCATTATFASGTYLQFGEWPQTVADVIESAESGGSGSSGSGSGSGSEVSSTGIYINLIGLYFGMGAVAVSAMAISKVLNKNKKKLEK